MDRTVYVCVAALSSIFALSNAGHLGLGTSPLFSPQFPKIPLPYFGPHAKVFPIAGPVQKPIPIPFPSFHPHPVPLPFPFPKPVPGQWLLRPNGPDPIGSDERPFPGYFPCSGPIYPGLRPDQKPDIGQRPDDIVPDIETNLNQGHGSFPQPGQGSFPQPDQGSFPQPGQGSFPQPDQDSFPQPGQGSFPQPDQGSFPQPDQGSFPQPGQGSFPQPGQGSFPQPDQGSFPQPDQGSFPQPGQGSVPQTDQDIGSDPINTDLEVQPEPPNLDDINRNPNSNQFDRRPVSLPDENSGSQTNQDSNHIPVLFPDQDANVAQSSDQKPSDPNDLPEWAVRIDPNPSTRSRSTKSLQEPTIPRKWSSVLLAPPFQAVCPDGQKPDYEGRCRDIWGR